MNATKTEMRPSAGAPVAEENKPAPADPVAAADRAAQVEAARTRAAQLLTERRFSEAKTALGEAEQLAAEPPKWKLERAAQAEAARTRAAQMLTERRFDEAKSALEEAEKLDAEPPKWKSESHRMISSLRAKLPKHKTDKTEVVAAEAVAEETGVGAVNKSLEIVSFYSKVAAGVGLLPGGLLNFAGVLAVDATMVWKIATEFGHTEGKEKIRGSILSLIGAAIPAGIGHSAGAAIAAIPALIAGTVVYFVATPILAYAMTQAVGNAFIMHFESGGTLLTFDSKAFGEYFLKEYQKAGGVIVPEAQAAKPAPEATPAS